MPERCIHDLRPPQCAVCHPDYVAPSPIASIIDPQGEPPRYTWELTVDRLAAAVVGLTKQLARRTRPPAAQSAVKPATREPDLTLRIYLSPIGYQIDYVQGEQTMSEGRDFGREHPRRRVAQRLRQEIRAAIRRFREGL